ncbi:MAG: class I SAM-dependent methyltransferase [Patescibacteria group bacterium]|nr:class I SAM-dependent methyltransferase [Patescibacteria group bacterium]
MNDILLNNDNNSEKIVYRPWLQFVNKKFMVKDNQFFFIECQNVGFTQGSNDLIVNKLKLLFKKFPKLFNLVYILFGVIFIGRNAQYAIRAIGTSGLILNLGSGVKKIRKDVVNVDFYPFDGVDIVADISELPFIDNSVDAVVSEFVLEHLPNPEKVVKEMFRVLKPGGILYISVPFVASFHSSPNDFFRWSKQGLRVLLKDFQEIESGIRCGPTSALVYVISEWLSTVLSFGMTKIQQILFMIFMICFSPLKLLDFVISKAPSSENIAYGFYFIGKKI